MQKSYEKAYLGSLKQRAFLQECRLSGGRAEGVRAVQVHGGNGLEFMVLPDRGMDIPYMFYKGKALHYASPTGIVHPSYYDPHGTEWLRGFSAGALTTCGITHAGPPEQDGNEALGLHGRISHIPADNMRCYEHGYNGDISLRIEGTLRDVVALGQHVELERSITTDTKRPEITIVDVIRNCGSVPVPIMMLYHFNFGYPLLNESSQVYGDFSSTEGANPKSSEADELESCRTCISPQEQYDERVFFHRWEQEAGQKRIGIIQDAEKDKDVLGVVLSYDGEELPELVQWKMMRKGAYVMGLEPCTVAPRGRSSLREAGRLPILEPGECRRITISYQVTETKKDFRTLMS